MQVVSNNVLGHHPQQAATSCSCLSGMSVQGEMDITPLRKMKIMLFLALLEKNFIFALQMQEDVCHRQN